MFITVSEHCQNQAELRQLESELDEGLELFWDLQAQGLTGEVNFIIERKDLTLHRKGSSGDLVIIGVDIERRIAKSIFLQHAWQVNNRRRKINKMYHSFIDWEV